MPANNVTGSLIRFTEDVIVAWDHITPTYQYFGTNKRHFNDILSALVAKNGVKLNGLAKGPDMQQTDYPETVCTVNDALVLMTKRTKITPQPSGPVGPFVPGLIWPGQCPVNSRSYPAQTNKKKKRDKRNIKKKKKYKKSNKRKRERGEEDVKEQEQEEEQDEEAKSMPKGLLCAKMLVRSGLRCSCHFVYAEKCPFLNADEPIGIWF